MSDPKRACLGITRKAERCKAAPLKDSDYCLAHSDANVRESVGFIANNGKAGRPPNPRAVDVLRERVEADIDKVLAPLFEALEAGRSVVVGNGPTAHVELVEDMPTRIAAVRELLDRAYGRPKSSSEVTHLTDSDFERAIRAMEVEFAELDSQQVGDFSVTGDD